MRLAQRPIIPQKGRGMFGKIRRFGSTALQKLKDAARVGKKVYNSLPPALQDSLKNSANVVKENLKQQAISQVNSGFDRFNNKINSSTALPRVVSDVVNTASGIARDHAIGRLNQI
jgi:hypothetical protein